MTDLPLGTPAAAASAADAVLDDLLMNVIFDGWTRRALDDALRRAEQDGRIAPGGGAAVFPQGVTDALAAFSDRTDRQMLAAVEAEGDAFEALKVREKIAFLVRARLEALEMHKEAVRRGLGVLALPHNVRLTARLTGRTCDRMWRAAGDRSTDLNWYTKRGLLAGVWSATVLYWLDDKSADHAETWAFLDRRIANVLAVGRRIGGVARAGDLAEAPFRLAARLRQRAVGADR